MKKAPALPLFGDAYLADTRHLSLEEHGAYLQLLMIAWRSDGCRLPNDDTILARMLGITGKKWAKLKPAVMAFWTLTKDGWEQKRLTKERRFVAKKSEQNAEAANARWSAKSLENKGANDADAYADAMPNGCQTDAPPPTPLKKKEEKKLPADAGLAFVGKVIRLTQSDFNKWRRAYPAVDLIAYLQARDDWLATEADEKTRAKWFLSTSNHLANLQQKLRGQVKPAVPI